MEEKIQQQHTAMMQALALYEDSEIIGSDCYDKCDSLYLPHLKEIRGDIKQALHYMESFADELERLIDLLEEAEAEEIDW